MNIKSDYALTIDYIKITRPDDPPYVEGFEAAFDNFEADQENVNINHQNNDMDIVDLNNM